MQKLTANDPATRSADIIRNNLEQLQALFPEALTEGKVDFEVLKQLLGGAVDEREEKFGLNWHGKRRARQLALTPSTGTLRPCPEDSVDWDTTQNLMIEGDNLEVLKLLQKSYAGKVKLIYIDPPYNTGKDFVYPDDFHDNIKNYLQFTGQVEGGRKISSNTESSGRFHTDWLNMMYPRLKLARNLLRDDGTIIISIDDSEFPNLRSVADEVFGEENFLATLVWDRNRKNDAKYFSVGHEYMLVYAKSKSRLVELDVVLREPKEGVEEVRALFGKLRAEHQDDWLKVNAGLRAFFRGLPEDDPRKPLGRYSKVDSQGPYRDDGDPSWPGAGGPTYEILHPTTKKPVPIPKTGWRFPTAKRFWEEYSGGRIRFGADENTTPGLRRELFSNAVQVMRSVAYSYAQTSANEFDALFCGRRVFDNPKPEGDLRRLVGYLTEPGDVICDFFAGSGTTGHSVMAHTAVDGGVRRYILVQLPEPLDPENKDQKTAADFCDKLGQPRNIAEVTKERLRRAAKKLKEENPLLAGDLGFRVFKLDSSNIRTWEPDRDNLPQTLLDSLEHLKADRTEADILYELLLKVGVDLCVPIEQGSIAGKAVHSIGGGVLIACLADSITRDEVEPLAQGIVAWHQEVAPAGTTTCVFRDSAFADDVAKTNLAAILSQHGLDTVRSL